MKRLEYPRREGVRPMDIIDGVVARGQAACIQFGHNPDVEELALYNEQARRAACKHEKTYETQDDYGGMHTHCRAGCF